MNDISISLDFMDKYILKSNHEYAMVYLCAYRYHVQGSNVPNPSQIAKILGMKTSDVDDAIEYWTTEGFNIFNQPKTKKPYDKSRYMPEEVAKFADSDSELSFLYAEAEKAMEKVLSTSDMQTLFWIYDYLGLPSSVTVMIMNYAKKEGKAKMRYIEKMAMDWSEKNIDNVTKAEQFLADIERMRTYEYHIKTLLGITSRELTPSEAAVIEMWESVLSPSDELIICAYEICIERKNKLSIKYINGILKSWIEKGFATKADVESERKTSKPSTGFSNFTPRTDINYEQLEIDALHKRINKSKKVD